MEKHWYRVDFVLEDSNDVRRGFTAHACAASSDEAEKIAQTSSEFPQGWHPKMINTSLILQPLEDKELGWGYDSR